MSLRVLGLALLTAAAFSVFAGPVSTLAGSLPRTPATETPILFGRPVAKFILETRIEFSAAIYGLEIPPGIFTPTIQDAEGVFYEAANGFMIVNQPVKGGLYASKSQPGRILVYVGNARGTGRHVQIWPRPLPADAVKKLKIGKPLRKN
jgi:hypothetical protein